jgi:hypothetical protein
MNTSAIRQQLHQYIDSADDKKIEAIFTILQADISHTSTFSNEELKMFYERRQKYLDGQSKTYSAEESHEYIRQSRKK